ncbi:hypothetical protein B0O99DRAFT_691757 [Bisporella sp. PMI_857]|nr:hypothetical protein B0O99DRAFT_691757 [Bisporella sp. PMI_857]
MRVGSELLGLPASLLLLITSYMSTDSASLAQAQWYRPSWSQFGRRAVEAAADKREKNKRSPVGVMKMSDDPNEKFYLEYWQFQGSLAQPEAEVLLAQHIRPRDLKEELRLSANASTPISFRPPFALHNEDRILSQELRARDAAGALAALQKRAFVCPVGTSDCSAIGAPNSCCGTDETCFPITDTGLGSVGCCEKGRTCGGTITACAVPNTPCAAGGGSYEYGGCCIPNYVCAGVGCIFNPALIVTVIVTQTFTIGTSSSVQTSTRITTISSSRSSDANTALQTTQACSQNSHACPVNFGGGCCENGYNCTPNTSCSPISGFSPTTTAATTPGTGVGAIRPTTDSSSFLFPTTSSSPVNGGSCPTGFYACSAFYRGGCCRTGRDCQTTDCPATSSTTIIDGSVTVVVPVGAGAGFAVPTGQCATGWSSCAASLGGNCCPEGYACGTASCSYLSPTQTAVVQKGSPSGAHISQRARGGPACLMLVLIALLVML